MSGASLERLRADFDRIALSGTQAWDHSAHYHSWVLERLPPRMDRALEVGCGTGAFACRLAERAAEVVALDLSPEMIRIAREQAGLRRIHYQVADLMDWAGPEAGFEAVVAIAMLHHVPLEPGLRKLASLVRPGGTLVVLDVYQPREPVEWALALLALPVSKTVGILHGRPLLLSEPAHRAWEEHARHERLPATRDVRALHARVLPGASFRRHLLWRWSLTWTKPR